MSTIKIIMAAYNGEIYLKEQIESILSNTYTDWHLTIYDDGSKDKTYDIIKEYEMRYPDKISGHKNEKNLGVKLNFLQGVLNNTMDYIMFCDQDDVWLPKKIEITLARMKQLEKEHKDIPVTVFTDAKIVDKHLDVIHESFYQTSKLDTSKVDLAHILMENKLLGCTTMMNKYVTDLVKTLPNHLRMHDWWIAILTASFGKIGFVNQSTILYRQHGNNVIGGAGFTHHVMNRIASLKEQKKVLQDTVKQAEEFYIIYKDILTEDNQKIIIKFKNLYQMNWFWRRYVVIKYGFLKTGVLRNIGVFLLI